MSKVGSHHVRSPLVRRITPTLLLLLMWGLVWHGVTAGARLSAPLPLTGFTPAVSQAIQEIDAATLTSYVGDLSGEWPVPVAGEMVTLSTRYSLADAAMDLVETYALERFEELGFSAVCHSYQLESMQRCNIVAEQRGALAPDRIVILGAHLDSITDSRTGRLFDAPGADDNASGAAAVLAAAGVLRDYELPFTVRYVLFTGEEQGLYGSMAYAEHVANEGQQIIAMVNLDMVGYNTSLSPPDIDVHIRSADGADLDRPIAAVFSRTLTTYNLGLLPEIVPSGTTASDHAAFWQQGYAAVLIIEDFEDFNPAYHTTQDLLAALDSVYFTKAAQSVVATVMQLAGVVDFVAKPGIVSVSQPVTLWAISHLPDTLPVSYSWDLGNGDVLDGPVITPTFTFGQYPATRNTWHVTMTVTYGGEALQVWKQLPVRGWDLLLPMVVRAM